MGSGQSKRRDPIKDAMDAIGYKYDAKYHSYFFESPPSGVYANRRSSGQPTSKKITSQLNRLFNVMSLCKQRQKAVEYAMEGVIASTSAAKWALRGGFDRLGLMFDEKFEDAFALKIDKIDAMSGKERKKYLHKFKTHVFEALDSFKHAKMFSMQYGVFVRFVNPSYKRPEDIVNIEEASAYMAKYLEPLENALKEKNVRYARELCSDGSVLKETSEKIMKRRLAENDEVVYRAIVSESNRRLA